MYEWHSREPRNSLLGLSTHNLDLIFSVGRVTVRYRHRKYITTVGSIRKWILALESNNLCVNGRRRISPRGRPWGSDRVGPIGKSKSMVVWTHVTATVEHPSEWANATKLPCCTAHLLYQRNWSAFCTKEAYPRPFSPLHLWCFLFSVFFRPSPSLSKVWGESCMRRTR